MEKLKPKEEQRAKKRIKFIENILCFSYIENSSFERQKTVIRITVRDISYGGLGVVCNKKLEIGDILVFNLNKSQLKREIKAEVRWRTYSEKEYILGLSFYELTRDDVLLIHEIIKTLDKSKNK